MKTKRGQMKSRRPSSGMRPPVKRGIHVKGSWKTVELDPSLFSEEGMGGLVCFEELTDYRLVDAAKTAVKEEKDEKKKGKKRKATEVAENGAGQQEAGDGGTVQPETSERPAKKRKKRKKKKVSQEEPTEQPDSSAGGEEKSEEKGPDQSPGDMSETVMEKAGEKEACEENVSPDVSLEKDAQTPVTTTTNDKKKKKKKRRKKKKRPADKQTVPEGAQAEEQTTTETPPQAKVVKLPKKKPKNWTDATSSGSADHNSDVSAWDHLFVPDPVLKALSSLGFGSPTAIQALALPPAIRDHMDIVGAAETGSGKTLSFGIPMIHAILEWKKGSDGRGEDGAEGQTGAASQVESLYLPATGDAEANGAMPDNGEETETAAVALSAETNDATAAPRTEETAEEAEPEESGDVAEPEETAEEAEPEESGDVAEPEETAEEAEPEESGDVAEPEETAEEAEPEESGDVAEPEESEDVAERDEDEGDDVSDGEDVAREADEEDESDDEKMGCVNVIEDMEFDFDGGPVEEEEAQPGGHKQPLLGLVLTPTRELAVQVKHHIDAVAKFTGVRTAIVVGGMAQQKQSRMLKRRPEIVIATPGRLWEMIKERHPHLLNLRQLRCLVIDEADRMVERGHFAELESLLEMLNTVQFNPKRQTFVFSATLTMAHSLPTRVLQKKGRKVDQRSKLELLMEKVGMRSKPKVIDLTRKEATVETLTETRIHCAKEEKDFFLYYFLLQYPGRTMVFANSIECIKRLNSLLVILDVTPLPLHANMHQKHRLKNLERFAERQSCVLLTTDVAARGLDIPNVQHVIHYQVPRTSETYVHRSGRTARATKEGLSLLLIGPDDMLNFKKIYRALGKDEDLPMFPIQSTCMAAIKERVNMARKIEKIEYHNSREKQHNSWFRQAAEALEVVLDEDVLLGGRKDEEDERQQQKMVKGMKAHLKHLLSQPVFKNVMKTKYPTQMGRLSLPQMPLAGVETAITSVSIQRKKQKHKKKPQQQQQQQQQQ